jgi:mRNA interferase MazF
LATNPPPKRGEIWLVNFDPTVGAEIKKQRPALVISSDAVGKLPLKLVAPITEWKESFRRNIWHVEIKPDASNGLDKPSAIDALQIRSVDLSRFIEKKGQVSATILEEVVNAVAAVIEFN